MIGLRSDKKPPNINALEIRLYMVYMEYLVFSARPSDVHDPLLVQAMGPVAQRN